MSADTCIGDPPNGRAIHSFDHNRRGKIPAATIPSPFSTLSRFNGPLREMRRAFGYGGLKARVNPQQRYDTNLRLARSI